MTHFPPGISVDDHFARFGAKSYAINKINSVEVRAVNPYGKGLMIAFALLAGIGFLTLMGDISGGQPFVGALIVTALFGGFAYWAYRRSQIVDYHLFLKTSSLEAQAFSSRNPDEVIGLRDSIESAMIGASGS